jgi:hypothetical protein
LRKSSIIPVGLYENKANFAHQFWVGKLTFEEVCLSGNDIGESNGRKGTRCKNYNFYRAEWILANVGYVTKLCKFSKKLLKGQFRGHPTAAA